jgi:HAD superfamily hydrolase (TIGR01509 family)
MIAALLWDVDGTLAETERDGHRVAFDEAFAAMGLPWRWDVAHYAGLLRVAGGFERLMADMALRPDAPADRGEREALARALHRHKNEAYARLVAAGVIALRPGVRALIDEAAARGVRQAVVTTTSRSNLTSLLAHTLGPQVTRCFTVMICGEDVAAKKPHPEAYQVALQRLGCRAAQTLAIEDAPAGVAAAAAAGVPVVVTRSVYFAEDPVDAALAVGPGLHTRCGWTPSTLDPDAGRLTFDDLQRWHGPAAP